MEGGVSSRVKGIMWRIVLFCFGWRDISSWFGRQTIKVAIEFGKAFDPNATENSCYKKGSGGLRWEDYDRLKIKVNYEEIEELFNVCGEGGC